MSSLLRLSQREVLRCNYFVLQIQGCDAILARMQEMLLGFQADLGGISDEIKHLQVRRSITEGCTHFLRAVQHGSMFLTPLPNHLNDIGSVLICGFCCSSTVWHGFAHRLTSTKASCRYDFVSKRPGTDRTINFEPVPRHVCVLFCANMK